MCQVHLRTSQRKLGLTLHLSIVELRLTDGLRDRALLLALCLLDVHLDVALDLTVLHRAIPFGLFDLTLDAAHLLLDFTLSEVQAFKNSLPKDDLPLVDQHLTALRDLEQKLLAQVGPGAPP